VSFFARLLRIAPAPQASDLTRGERALRVGDLAAAESYFAAALAAAPTGRERALAYNKQALVALARADGGAADAALAQALALDPHCVPAIVNAANRLLEAGETAAAIARYELAIRLDADFPEAHHNLGVAYKRAGRQSDAVRELRRATGLERRRNKGIR
jgi:tetratricopeptide (TPR) repeat protein